jgi:hypothetical protein
MNKHTDKPDFKADPEQPNSNNHPLNRTPHSILRIDWSLRITLVNTIWEDILGKITDILWSDINSVIQNASGYNIEFISNEWWNMHLLHGPDLIFSISNDTWCRFYKLFWDKYFNDQSVSQFQLWILRAQPKALTNLFRW